MAASNWPYSTNRWRRVRRQVLVRDRGICQVRMAGCQVVATHADHIQPVSKGGAPFDLGNLRASCRRCNVTRANKGRRPGATGAPAGPSPLFAN